MRTKFQTRQFRQGIRDGFAGLALFLVLATGFSGHPGRWDVSSAAASDRAAAEAIEMSVPALMQPAFIQPAFMQPESPMLAAMFQGRPIAAPRRSAAAMTILALTFSLMFSFNLALLRHLRRVFASPRRGEWRRGH